MVIGKVDDDQSKTLSVGLFFLLKCPGCGHNSMPEYNTILTKNHNCVTHSSAKLLSPSVGGVVIFSATKHTNSDIVKLTAIITLGQPGY